METHACLVFQVTYVLAKELPTESFGGKSLKTCSEYSDESFDDCIDSSVSKEMGRLFGCFLPFLRHVTHIHTVYPLRYISEEACVNQCKSSSLLVCLQSVAVSFVRSHQIV